ncbi:sensor histidine kinase [Spelaeicoccus albus]
MSVLADTLHDVKMNDGRPARTPAQRVTAWGLKCLWIAGTLCVAWLCTASAMFSLYALPIAFQGAYDDPQSVITNTGMLLFMLALACDVTLFWRRRVPWLPVAAGLLLTVVLQMDALLALVGVASFVGRRRGKGTMLWTAAAIGAAAWAGIRDGLRPADHSATSLILDLGDETGAQPQQFIVAIVVTAVAIGAAVAYGLIRRSRREVKVAEQRTLGEKRRGDSLSTTVARQDEREMLAQEVHDALAHRLSLISLQSQSLKVLAKSADPAVAAAATALQSNAHKSLDDLRNLIGVLREPAAESPRPHAEVPLPPGVGLTDLQELVETSRRAGMTINSSILLSDTAGASPLLDKAAYRVVQEALTNVQKHSPSSPVWLWVRAEAGNGVLIRVVNPIGAVGPLDATGCGAGVVGMRERAAMLGGTTDIGPDGHGSFLVDVHLPWHQESETAGRPVGAA